MKVFTVAPIAHRQRHVAIRIHEVMALAYSQEAGLLGVSNFPPLERSIEYFQSSEDFFLGASLEAELVGVLSAGPGDDADSICITALVVHPCSQRKGVGRLLLQEAFARGKGAAFTVATAAKNLPALRLYQEQGFSVYQTGVMGPENLAMLRLRRAA